mgnify:FL=1
MSWSRGRRSNMGELRVRSALVTGANRGIGLGFVQHLLALPNPPEWVFATCRDPKGQRAQVRLGWDGAEVGDSRAGEGDGMCEGLQQGAAAPHLRHRTGKVGWPWDRLCMGCPGLLGVRLGAPPSAWHRVPQGCRQRAGVGCADQRVTRGSHQLSSTGAAEIGLQAPQPGHRPARYVTQPHPKG